jgi:hypothetical protein
MNADDPPKLTGLTVQQMMDRVREDFQEKQYYVTGNFSSELFTDECVASKAEHAEPTLMLLCNGIYSRARVWWWSQLTRSSCTCSCLFVDPTVQVRGVCLDG